MESGEQLGIVNIFKCKCLVSAHFWSDLDEFYNWFENTNILYKKIFFFHQKWQNYFFYKKSNVKPEIFHGEKKAYFRPTNVIEIWLSCLRHFCRPARRFHLLVLLVQFDWSIYFEFVYLCIFCICVFFVFVYFLYLFICIID